MGDDGWGQPGGGYGRQSQSDGRVHDRGASRASRAGATLLDEVGNVYCHASVLASTVYGALGLGNDRDAKELLERATPIARQLDDPSMWMLVRGNLGLAELLTGDADAARHAFREELMLCRQLDDRHYLSEGLRGLAAVAAVHGDLRRAARLVGASSAHRYGQPFDVIEARLDASFFDAARARCGTKAWDAAGREGAC